MCGIAGVIAFEEMLRDKERIYEKMQSSIARRGPDQKGIMLSDHAVLIHTRLSVIDPDSGRQPMQYTDGTETYTIVYNGELYNTEELRRELLQRGYTFDTHSDTEVLLKAYAEYGEDCVSLCNGIFAFAVWEHKRQRLFLARDRIGVKPLFYHMTKEHLI
ncbi:MAG: asparagine synthetase B, partial [Oscillospiraceae bacterium]|nr:asparagine synthetase B [Oscillospiraceae bacterium]